METTKFVHCPVAGCNKKLNGSWKDYAVNFPSTRCPKCNLLHKVTKEEFDTKVAICVCKHTFPLFSFIEKSTVYQCPNCKYLFTADDVIINALPLERDDLDVVLYNFNTEKIMFFVNHEQIFTDGDTFYAHIPVSIIINKFAKCYCFDTEGLSDQDILGECKNMYSTTGRK